MKTRPGTLMLGLIVFALLFRAAIPAGFMLDVSAGRTNALMLTLCTAGGVTISVPVDVGPDEDHSTQDMASNADCAFGASSSHAIVPGTHAVMAALAMAGVDQPALAHKAAPALPAVGPPLGSRAPPSLLV